METDARLEQLIQGNTAANARMAELTNEVVELRKQVKTDSAAIDELKTAVKEIKSSFESVQAKKDTDLPEGAVSRIEVVNKDPSPGEKESGAQNAYVKAFGKFSSNDYPGAVAAFEAFIRNYPGSEYAGNAQYWIGECHYSQRDFHRALEAFNKVLAKYPKGNKVTDAMLKIGYSYISMNEPTKAKSALQSLVDKYPNSQAAIRARDRLSRY